MNLLDSLNTGVLSAFGREITYSLQAAEPVTVKGVLQEGHRREDTAPGVYALLFLRLADLVQPPERGDEVVIDAATYKVFEIEADGQGGITLALRLE